MIQKTYRLLLPSTSGVSVDIACYEWGNPDAAETVICLHGLTRNGRDFDFLAHALCEKYRVLCPDMPGRGKSSRLMEPALYAYPVYLSLIQQWLGVLGLRQAHWIGTSMGGILGMMVANAVPGFLSSLVLNDVGCFIPKDGLQRITRYAGSNVMFAARAEAEAALRRNCATFGIRDESHWQHLFTHSLQDTPGGGIRLAYDPAIMAAIPKGDDVADVTLWPMWEAVKPIPTLLIRGAESDILLKGTAEHMQATHPRMELIEIPQTGHAPSLMDRGQITLVREWIKRKA